MDIFNIEKSEQEIKMEEIRRCAEYRKGAIEAHISAYEVAFNDFWENGKVTPNDHFDIFGKEGKTFIDFLKKTEDYIKSVKPDWKAPEIPFEYQEDAGKISIGDKKPINVEIIEEEIDIKVG